ncbi:MAG: HNH endonuclease [Clostridia bacterium]|nr:HNH endonuclease [Clostridia bacterium]
MVLKVCSTCGRIHEFNTVCPKRIESIKKRQTEYDRNKYHRNSAADLFRNSKNWQRKRNEIKSRDLNICRYCFLVRHKITTSNLSVHHITSLDKDFDLRLNNNNLITLCRECHEKAEKGIIKPEKLQKLIHIPLKLT